MYLFKKKDGSLIQAPEAFDQQNPGWEEMQDVEEVLFVSKVLIPQIKLVPKPASPSQSAVKTESDSRQTKKKQSPAREKYPYVKQDRAMQLENWQNPISILILQPCMIKVQILIYIN